MKNKTFNHTTSQDAHPRSLVDLKAIVSYVQSIKVVTQPTNRFFKKMELDYLYCPDCESQEIYRNGKSQAGTQRFMCKGCNYQFVAQFDAVFPKSKRRQIFEKEFNQNLKPTGFDKLGTGKKKYWKGARLETLQILESQAIRIRANKIIKTNPIQGNKDYQVLLVFLVHEAYHLSDS